MCLSANVHVYGKCQEYVGVHELLIRVHEHGSGSHFLVFLSLEWQCVWCASLW